MPETTRQVDRALRDLARVIQTAPPSGRLSADILERVAAAPVPGRSAVRIGLARWGQWLHERWRWLAGLLLALSLTVVVVSPVGAEVVKWIGFHGVTIETDPDAPTGRPEVPPASGELTLEQAGALVDFRPGLPELLGVPDRVSVSLGRRLLAMSWEADTSGVGTTRLDQFDAALAPGLSKRVREAVRVRVGAQEGLWIPGPHEVVLLDPFGPSEEVPPRLASMTLIWAVGERTYRLEGDLTRARAVEIAESVR